MATLTSLILGIFVQMVTAGLAPFKLEKLFLFGLPIVPVFKAPLCFWDLVARLALYWCWL